MSARSCSPPVRNLHLPDHAGDAQTQAALAFQALEPGGRLALYGFHLRHPLAANRFQRTHCGEFFEQYFEANLLDKGLTKIAHEGGRAHGLLNVTPSDFFSLKITIPNSEEQTAIAQVLQAADKEIQLLKAKTDKLREQKKGMMQVLLTGKKRLKIKI